MTVQVAKVASFVSWRRDSQKKQLGFQTKTSNCLSMRHHQIFFVDGFLIDEGKLFRFIILSRLVHDALG